MPRLKADDYRLPTAEESAAMGEIRQRSAYQLMRVWGERVLDHQNDGRIKTRRVVTPLGSVVILVRSTLEYLKAPNRPLIAEALAEEDFEACVALALDDLGFRLALIPDGSMRGSRCLGTNLSESHLWRLRRSVLDDFYTRADL